MKSLVTFERAMYSHRSSYSRQEDAEGGQRRLGLEVVVRRLGPGAAPAPAGERADVDRGLGVDRDPQGVVGPIGLGVDLLQLLEDGVGLLDFFWGRHLATLVRRKPSRLSFVLIVCWVGNSLVGVALGGDQLAADLGGTDAGEEPVGLELGVGLALAVGDGPDVVEQSGQVLLGGLAAAAVEGIDAGHAGAEFVHPLADRLPVPAEMGLGPDAARPAPWPGRSWP